MDIGIIGAGNIGTSLARVMSSAGHNVRMACSRSPEAIAELCRAIGATAVTAPDAVSDVDVVIVSIPFFAIAQLEPAFARVSKTVTVIDTCNYFPFRDGTISAVDAGQPESIWVMETLGRPVIKAWNSISVGSLTGKGRAKHAADRIGLAVSGDDVHGKQIALELIDVTGFDGVDAGGLGESWRQQPGTPAYCTDLPAADLPRALAAANRADSPRHRELIVQRLRSAGSAATNDFIVELSRSVSGLSGA